jgi:hypothetical protein
MNQLNPLPSPARQQPQQTVNPFARALAESENSVLANGMPPQQAGDPFAEALARSGGSFGDFPTPGGANNQFGPLPDWINNPSSQFSPEDQQLVQQRQMEEMQRQQELAALRRRLHDKVNPVDQTDLFSAREAEVKKQIEELKKELKAMSREIQEFHKEVDLTLMTETVDPGVQGNYFVNFFHQLRQWIALLRQHVRSARTWAQQGKMKAKKKPKRGGILIQGQQSEQTSAIFDTMHHERSATYGGS